MRDVIRLPLELGQLVRRRDDPETAAGQLVGLVLTLPRLGIVRWKDHGATFEPLETLVAASRLVL